VNTHLIKKKWNREAVGKGKREEFYINPRFRSEGFSSSFSPTMIFPE
jgi:hypothetical protein